MPPFADWLKASWADFRRRWGVLFTVIGMAGAATLAAAFLPFVPAALATFSGVGPVWAVWGTAWLVSVLAILWLSTWAQAAIMRAALTEETWRECLSVAWKQAGPFALVLSLVLVALVGGYFLFIIPGLILSVMLFAAPFCQISGEADGTRALGLSWARVKPRFWTVALRLLAATFITAAPGWLPYVGWIVMLFWAPFSIVAMARLDKDLRAAEPDAKAPDWMGSAVAALTAVVLVGAAAISLLTVKLARAAIADYNSPNGVVSRVRPETAQALMAALAGQSGDAEKKKAFDDLIAELRGSSAAPAAPAVSTDSIRIVVSSAPAGPP